MQRITGNKALALGIGLVAALGSVAVSTALFADNTDTSSVSVGGTIVAPLTVVATPMVLPHIVRPQGAEPDAKLNLVCGATGDSGNVVSYTQGNSNPFAKGVAAATLVNATSTNKTAPGANYTGTCAVLTIAGESNYNLISTISLVSNTTTGVTVSSVSCTDQLNNTAGHGAPLQLVGSSLTVRCGAALKVTSTAPSSYAASFAYTVTYD